MLAAGHSAALTQHYRKSPEAARRMQRAQGVMRGVWPMLPTALRRAENVTLEVAQTGSRKVFVALCVALCLRNGWQGSTNGNSARY